MRVLIVDDDPIIRRMLGRILGSKTTFTIAGEAGNGAEAVVAVTDLNPDVIVMDIDMPVMDGAEAAAEIKRNHPHIHILAFTGSCCPDTRIQLERAGVTAIIDKAATAELIYQLNAAEIRRGTGEIAAQHQLSKGTVEGDS